MLRGVLCTALWSQAATASLQSRRRTDCTTSYYPTAGGLHCGNPAAFRLLAGIRIICWGSATGWDGQQRKRLHIFYSGRVQGVGFRYTVKSVVSGFEVTGMVRNLPDGRVELLVEGDQAELEEFRKAIQDSEVGGLIRNEEVNWADATGELRGFEIRH